MKRKTAVITVVYDDNYEGFEDVRWRDAVDKLNRDYDICIVSCDVKVNDGATE
jgi:hypothetical protein